MIKVAIVGIGRVGKAHIAQAESTNKFKFVDFCECDEELKNKIEEEYKIKGYVSYDQMLANTKADIILIATPSHLHYQQTLDALGKGFNVMVEKPMASSMAEAEAMKNAVKDGNFLTINQCRRFFKDVQFIKKSIDSGELGDIFQIYISLNNFEERTDWQIHKKYNGGLLNNHGVHMIDTLLYLIDSKPISVLGKSNIILDKGDAEDCFKAIITMENGCIAEAEFTKSLYPKPMWHICGTKGTIYSPRQEPQAKIYKTIINENGEKEETILKIDYATVPDSQSHYYHYTALGHSLETTGKPVVDVDEVLTVMKVIDGLKKSNGVSVTINNEE